MSDSPSVSLSPDRWWAGVLGLIGRLRPMGETCFLLADKRSTTPREDECICSRALFLHD